MNDTLEKNSGGGGNSDRVKAKFVKVEDGKTIKLRFLQELDPDNPNYNDEAGTGFLAVEHVSPSDFKKRAVCTIDDEGRCYGCEKHQEDFKAGWRQKMKLYINVLVYGTDADGNPTEEVQVLSQGNGPKSVTPWLLEYAAEDSLTDKTFRLTRKGKGQTDTSYTMMPGKVDDSKYDVSQHELYDLEKVVMQVPYDQQAEFFGGGNAAPAADSSTSTEIDW